MVVLWLVLAVLFVAAEALTAALFAIFVALGLAAAAALAALGTPLWVQLAGFVAVSVGGVLGARPPVIRAMEHRREAAAVPGVQSLVGQRALSVDVIGDEHHPGHALLAGERWLAVTDATAALPADSVVVVAAVRGTTLIVRPAARAEPASPSAAAT